MSEAAARPLPVPSPENELSADFWQHCANEKLCFQRCGQCRTWRHLPRYLCAKCHSSDWEWAESSGRGVIFSWTVTHRPIDPGWAHELPDATLVVEMNEGVRVVGALRGLPLQDLALDLPVIARPERAGDDFALLYFEPA